LLRFADNVETHHQEKLVILPTQLRDALHACIKVAQQETCTQEINDICKKGQVSSKSQLQPLHTFLDKEYYLQVGGSSQQSNLPYDSKHQLILLLTHHLQNLS
jgi:hypothetical protein